MITALAISAVILLLGLVLFFMRRELAGALIMSGAVATIFMIVMFLVLAAMRSQ